MANTASPRGLRAGGPLLSVHMYAVSAGYATAMYIGDPVTLTGTANQVQVASVGSTNVVLGAIVGVYDSNKVPGIQASTGERYNYKPASTAAYVLVADHPQQVFIMQTDSGNTLTVNDCGANVSMASAAGSTFSGQSGWVIAAGTTPSAGTTEQLRLIRPVDRVDNDATLTNNDWYVQINYHQRNAGSVGLGIA